MRRAGVVVLAAALAAGCGTTPAPVAFQPWNPGGTAGDSLAVGGALRVATAAGVRLAVQPTWLRQPLDGPAFTLHVANGSATAVRVAREDVRAFFRGAPVALAARAERLAAVQAAERRRAAIAETVAVAVGIVAVAAALWGIAAGWDGAIVAGHGTLAVQTPLGGLAAGVAIAGVGEEALQRLDIEDPAARRAVADAILDAITVPPGRSATAQVVLERCCASRLRADDTVRLEVAVGGETVVFEFLRVPLDDPTRLLPP